MQQSQAKVAPPLPKKRKENYPAAVLLHLLLNKHFAYTHKEDRCLSWSAVKLLYVLVTMLLQFLDRFLHGWHKSFNYFPDNK